MTGDILSRARQLGFDIVGISTRLTPVHFDAFQRWLDAGMAGAMGYLRNERRRDVRSLLDDARSVIVVGVNYAGGELDEAVRRDPSRGIISSYARGKDYHPWMLSRLEELSGFIESLTPGSRSLTYVDTGPVMERDFASLAGLGFIGKNTCLIHPRRGSYFFLGVVITNIELTSRSNPPDISCGTCTRCIEACPTGALLQPHVLDARRCISYLTIEHKGAIPRELRPLIGNRIFGCDECQLVCPWNEKFSTETSAADFQSSPEQSAPELISLARLTEEEFRKRFAGTAVLRTKRRGFLRNVAVALGNWGAVEALAPLERLFNDDEPLIRRHAAWALGRCSKAGRRMLKKRKWIETDEGVFEEIEAALR